MSTHTIASYRFTFILFIGFMEEKKKITATKLLLKHITKDTVVEFLNYLQVERKCSAATRNVRLSGLHAFFHFLQYKLPDHLAEWQSILSVRVKKTRKESIRYLSIEAIKLLLEQPDTATRKGRRDLAMLSLMYDCAARVGEIIDLSPDCIRMDKPYTIKLTGKGRKIRIVPLMEEGIQLLKRYMNEHQLFEPHRRTVPLFYNSRQEKLTRAGINTILQQYGRMANEKNPGLIADKISPHWLRHSKAMHLLQAGVNLVYIRDVLGHESVQTTEIYARADSKQKREAIEKAYVNVVKQEIPQWVDNQGLLDWLKSFK